MKVKNRLRDLRKEKGLTIQSAAEKLEVTKNTLSRYETGKRVPKADFLQRAADFYNCTVDYIMKRTNIKYDANEKIMKALEDDLELADFWGEMSEREDLQLMMKQTRKLDKEAIQSVISIMQQIEKEEK